MTREIPLTQFEPDQQAQPFDSLNPQAPLIAVIIPVYKHPQFLFDAVISAVRQTMNAVTKVVIVNDGCPYASTDWLGRFLQERFPDVVYYIKKSNGGLSSARNSGIRFALSTWKSIEFVFPLDADNVLSPTTLEQLVARIRAAPPDTGWVYQDLVFFGEANTYNRMGIPFNQFRLLYDNFSDAGSLIHRRLFDAGLYFDERMKRGYEDWDFFIAATLQGYSGIHAPGTGFYYRKHGQSMLAEAREVHDSIVESMWTKRHKQLTQDRLLAIEHAQMPRFAFVDYVTSEVQYFSLSNAEPTRCLTLDQFLGDVASWAKEMQPKETYVPAFTIFGTRSVLKDLDSLKLLPATLFNMQLVMAKRGFVCLNVANSDRDGGVSVGSDRTGVTTMFAAKTGDIAWTCAFAEDWKDVIQGQLNFGAVISVAIGGGHTWEAESSIGEGSTMSLDTAVSAAFEKLTASLHGSADLHLTEDEFVPGDPLWSVASHSDFCGSMHGSLTKTVFPSAGYDAKSSRITLAVERLDEEDARQELLRLARDISAIFPESSLKLVLTTSEAADLQLSDLETFSEVRFSSRHIEDHAQAVGVLLSTGDLAITFGSAVPPEAMAIAKSKGRLKFISYVDGAFSVSARRLMAVDRLTEGYIASDEVRTALLNEGGIEDRLWSLPNDTERRRRVLKEVLSNLMRVPDTIAEPDTHGAAPSPEPSAKSWRAQLARGRYSLYSRRSHAVPVDRYHGEVVRRIEEPR